ncbi:MAG: hypothetical protein ABII00_09005 [Elusimicrobiota bacterium]
MTDRMVQGNVLPQGAASTRAKPEVGARSTDSKAGSHDAAGALPTKGSQAGPAGAATGNRGKRSRNPKDGPKVEGGTTESRLRAALVLEVLAGELLPAEAAELLGVSQQSYFHLERRALEALVHGCEPTPKGRKRSEPEKELAKLKTQVKRLEQESARYQALARATRGATGLSSSQRSRAKSRAAAGKKRRAKPTVRALKVARALKPSEEPSVRETEGTI